MLIALTRLKLFIRAASPWPTRRHHERLVMPVWSEAKEVFTLVLKRSGRKKAPCAREPGPAVRQECAAATGTESRSAAPRPSPQPSPALLPRRTYPLSRPLPFGKSGLPSRWLSRGHGPASLAMQDRFLMLITSPAMHLSLERSSRDFLQLHLLGKLPHQYSIRRAIICIARAPRTIYINR